MKQADAVYEAMKNLGGFATFNQLNHTTNLGNWGTITPFASIRRIVQQDKRFFKVKPGLWALEEQRDKLAKIGVIADESAPEKAHNFEHGYYQGLLVEIGNVRQMQTFVPYQDKNRIFTGSQKLRDIVKLEKFYEFTYSKLVKRAITIDVTWFNERALPSAFFEVEHSTDIQNSLLKFLELQDFRAQFHIVAAEARRNEFEAKLNYAAFKTIKSCIKFVNYDELAKMHSRETEAAHSRVF